MAYLRRDVGTITERTLNAPIVAGGTLTSPTFVTPALGTVASGVISACTSSGMVMVAPALGTPASGNASNLTSIPSSLTAVTWRMVNHESTGSPNPLGGGGSDWEVSDDTKMEYYLGAADQITESSGYFSFGSTGYWLILGMATLYTDGGHVEAAYFELQATEDNSAYSNIAVGVGGGLYEQYSQTSINLHSIVKVDDLTNQKVKLKGQSIQGADGQFAGNGTNNLTALTFVKLSGL